MELGKVIFSDLLNSRFEELIFILFHKKYFSYQSNAIDYVNKIYDFISIDIHTFPQRKTPQDLKYLGSQYIFYKSNKRTTWYVFFEKSGDDYLITGILNNHCEEANDL